MMRHFLLLIFFLYLRGVESIWLDSCQEIKAEVPDAEDGEYCLAVKQDSETHMVKIYCHEMNGAPQEFITLPAGEEENYSKTYTESESSFTGHAFFSKIAVDLQRLEVPSADYSFARLENQRGHDLDAKRPAWGKSWSCDECTDTSVYGKMALNLAGTQFHLPLNLTFVEHGRDTCAKDITYSDKMQAVTTECSGKCGGCFPDGLKRAEPKFPLVINKTLSKTECSLHQLTISPGSKVHKRLRGTTSNIQSWSRFLGTISKELEPFGKTSIILRSFTTGQCIKNVMIGCSMVTADTSDLPLQKIMENISSNIGIEVTGVSLRECHTARFVLLLYQDSYLYHRFFCEVRNTE